jgi:hypothetical protein
MESYVRWSWALLLCAGCASAPTLIPEQKVGDKLQARAEGGGVVLDAIPNGWTTEPATLPEAYTPVFVHLTNNGDQAYDVTYATLTLINESGRIFAAIPPMEVVRVLLGQSAPSNDDDERVPPGPVEVAESDVGFDVGGGLLAQWGPYPGYYDPFNPPLGYGPNAYPPNTNSAAYVLNRAFREGRLLPKTQAGGFVYFQRAYDSKVLTLRLEAPNENPVNAPLLIETRFDVNH